MATAIKFAVQTQKQLPPAVVETLFECLQNEKDLVNAISHLCYDFAFHSVSCLGAH